MSVCREHPITKRYRMLDADAEKAALEDELDASVRRLVFGVVHQAIMDTRYHGTLAREARDFLARRMWEGDDLFSELARQYLQRPRRTALKHIIMV